MTASASWFLVPPEMMKKFEEEMAESPISVVPQSSNDGSPAEKGWGQDFVNVLHPALPTSGVERLGPTENAASTSLSSGNRCLDFFVQVTPTTPESELVRLATLASWHEDALTALKLIFNLLNVSGTGKASKELFYHAVLWLHAHHPATLGANGWPLWRHPATSTSSWRLFCGWCKVRRGFNRKLLRRKRIRTGRIRRKRNGVRRKGAKQGGCGDKSSEERAAAALERDRQVQARAAEKRREDREEKPRRAHGKFPGDSKFRALYLEVAGAVAHHLKADARALQEGRLKELSLAAKWTPSLGSSYDEQTMLCYAIARQIFPKERHQEYAELSDPDYGIAVRGRLRREVLAPLRSVLQSPDQHMSPQEWGNLTYHRAWAVAMTMKRKWLRIPDADRFNQFLMDEEAAREVLPHDMMKPAMDGGFDPFYAKVADFQWNKLVGELRKLGSLSKCLGVCDISRSMRGEPMDLFIALGILVLELSEEPWKGNVIPFSHQPEILRITEDTLKDKGWFVRKLKCGTKIDLQLVFDRILTMARAQSLAPENLIKRLVIFSDKEFDQACSKTWEAEHDAIVQKFQFTGLGRPPEIVYWNLGHESSIPVTKFGPGVAVVSGFSKSQQKVFLKKDGEINADPTLIVNEAISGPEYAGLEVVD